MTDEASLRNLSCLEIARRKFHHRVCGKDWRWLHEALQTYRRDLGHTIFDVPNRVQGTVLSLLLREVLDMTLAARTNPTLNDPHLLAHEIDALLPLSAEEFNREQRFPFSYVGNVIVPFDVAESLGVNIFRDLDFDTWVMQLVLRQLTVYATTYPNPATEHLTHRLQAPSQLYVMSGFALFNHACCHAEDSNASWAWDHVEQDPLLGSGRFNRILVRADRAIRAAEEIRVRYSPCESVAARARDAQRYLGRPCNCRRCQPPSRPASELL